MHRRYLDSVQSIGCLGQESLPAWLGCWLCVVVKRIYMIVAVLSHCNKDAMVPTTILSPSFEHESRF